MFAAVMPPPLIDVQPAFNEFVPRVDADWPIAAQPAVPGVAEPPLIDVQPAALIPHMTVAV